MSEYEDWHVCTQKEWEECGLKYQIKLKQLREALIDCMSYVDIDNLTMQTKYRNWCAVIDGKPWNPSNVDIEE